MSIFKYYVFYCDAAIVPFCCCTGSAGRYEFVNMLVTVTSKDVTFEFFVKKSTIEWALNGY